MKWSFYSEETGRFLSRVMSCTSVDDVKANTPQGYVAIDGEYDARCQRFDLDAGEVVSFIPERPDDDHEWNDRRKRWEKRADVQISDAARQDVQRRIEKLESKQLRPMRELARDPEDIEARRRLDQIDTEIAELRSVLSAETETTGRGSQSR